MGLAHDKVTHHAMVVFEKPAGKYVHLIDKRTQLTGEASLRSESARTTIQNLLQTIIVLLHLRGSMIYFCSWAR